MLKHLEGAKLGIFIFLGTVLLVVAVFLIGNKEALFVKSFYVKSYFQDVSGLRNGAPVRLSGLNIGSVSNLQIAPGTKNLVEVTMRINSDMRQFIRLDSKATIQTEGLVGGKVVSITPGTQNYAVISNNGVIKSKQQISLTKIIEETQGTIGYLKNLTKNLSEITKKVNKGKGTFGKIINDNSLYYAAVHITKSADSSLVILTRRMDAVSGVIVDLSKGISGIINNIDSSTAELKHIVRTVKKGKGVLGALINDRSAYDSMQVVINNLVITSKSAMEGAQSFSEDMEALKHNWLFKKYFEERGYWSESKYQKKIDKVIKKYDKKIKELKALESKIDSLKNSK